MTNCLIAESFVHDLGLRCKIYADRTLIGPVKVIMTVGNEIVSHKFLLSHCLEKKCTSIVIPDQTEKSRNASSLCHRQPTPLIVLHSVNYLNARMFVLRQTFCIIALVLWIVSKAEKVSNEKFVLSLIVFHFFFVFLLVYTNKSFPTKIQRRMSVFILKKVFFC